MVGNFEVGILTVSNFKVGILNFINLRVNISNFMNLKVQILYIINMRVNILNVINLEVDDLTVGNSGVDKKGHLFLQQLVQLLLAILQPSPVGRVDDPDEAVRRLEVVTPVRPQRLLAADVPDVQVEAETRQELLKIVEIIGVFYSNYY
jgi:hypothetical protein